MTETTPWCYRHGPRWGQFLLVLSVSLVFLLMVLPSLVVIAMSFSDTEMLRFPPQGFSLRHYRTFFEDKRWFQPALLSLRYAFLSTVVKVVLGTMASLALVRGRFRGKRIINLILLSPLMIPPIAIAVAAYSIYVKFQLVCTTLGVVVAHTVLGIPTVILVITAVLYRFDTNLELAAMSLGAGRLTTFWRITLPLIRVGIAVAAIFAFIDSFNELIVTNFIVGTRNLTLPVQIYTGLRYTLSPVITAISALMIGMALLGLLLIAPLSRRR
jgi:putative spermidine/putrescine transport system permease protein